MNIASESWTLFDKEYSKTYLHDGNFDLLRYLASKILSEKENPRIADIGCGNCRFFKELAAINKPFKYEGFDISPPLIEAARSSYSESPNFCITQISDDFTGIPLDSKYDFSVAIHVAELCSSIERLFHVLSNSSDNFAIIWYEFPRFEFTELEIRKYVNHQFSEKDIVTPYLRNKYSKNFYNHLLDRFSLKEIFQAQVSEKDRLIVYGRKSEK